MTFDKINRRTHLYLGIVLMPWFLLYALSSVVLNHGSVASKAPPRWTRLFEKKYQLPPITEDTDHWALAGQILRSEGLEGRHRAHFDENENLVVLRQKFVSHIRLTYYPAEGRLVADQRPLNWNEALTQAHFRAGYTYPYLVEVLWAITIDLLVLATLIWIASGLFIWARLKRFRLWGWLALGAGMASFLVVVLGL